jgi:hypothetical protein
MTTQDIIISARMYATLPPAAKLVFDGALDAAKWNMAAMELLQQRGLPMLLKQGNRLMWRQWRFVKCVLLLMFCVCLNW